MAPYQEEDEVSDDRKLTELISEIVDKGATTVEDVHRAIADMPLEVLDRLEIAPATTQEVRRIQDQSIGAIYDLIREVNQRVAQLAADLLEGGGKKERDAE